MKCWTRCCYNLTLDKNVNFNSMINLFKLSFNNISSFCWVLVQLFPLRRQWCGVTVAACKLFPSLGHPLCVCSPSGHWDSGLAPGFSQVPVAMPTGNCSPRMSNDVMWLRSKVPTKTLLPPQYLITHHCCQVLPILTCLHRGCLPSRKRCVYACATMKAVWRLLLMRVCQKVDQFTLNLAGKNALL